MEGQLCQDMADRLNFLRSNPDNLSFLSVSQDQENEDEDDRPIRQRSEQLVTIFFQSV